MTTSRYNAFKAYRLLTGWWFALPLLLSIIATSALAATIALGAIPSAFYLPLLLILFGISLGMLLLFLFAITYVRLPEADFLFALGKFLHRDTGLSERGIRSLIKSPVSQKFIKRLELPEEDLQLHIEEHFAGIEWPKLQEKWIKLKQDFDYAYLLPEIVLAGFMLNKNSSTFLRLHNLTEEDVEIMLRWIIDTKKARAKSLWWLPENLLSFSGIGLSWTSGHTPLLDRFARIPKGNMWDRFIAGRKAQLDQLIATLARLEQSNVLLVGRPGVGRLGLIKELASRVRQQQAHPELNGQRVVYVHVGELLAGADSEASQLALVSRAISEMESAGNVIAVIDGISSILSTGQEQRLNLTDVLLPFFSSLNVRVVVIISADDYHLRLKTNSELLHFFEVVQVESASPSVTISALLNTLKIWERETDIYIPYKTIRSLVKKTRGIIQEIPYPERAFDALEEALVEASAKRRKELLDSDINSLISRKVGIPIGNIDTQERDYLLNIETIMHRRVVNQSSAISALAKSMIRARAGVRATGKPMGTFLFLGPTGVGKTETAKTLAEAYFGSDSYITRFDMSEFQGEEGIARLIGSSRHPVGRLTGAISDKPFTVLLLDEFEKAHPIVQQLFLQVFDEGRLTDVRGNTVSFEHAMIIATSNAGAELIWEQFQNNEKNVIPEPQPAGEDIRDLGVGSSSGFNKDFEEDLKNYIVKNNIFRPELLNRFDGVITFSPLTPDHVAEIARRMLKALNRRLDAKHGITVSITDALVEKLVQNGYDPEFGARPMARAIQDLVEYPVAQKILKNQVTPGDQITLTI